MSIFQSQSIRYPCSNILDYKPKHDPRGLYVFWLGETPMYVGKAEAGLFARVRQHLNKSLDLRSDLINYEFVDCVLIILNSKLEVELIPHKKFIKIKEAQLIRQLNPVLNSKTEDHWLNIYNIEINDKKLSLVSDCNRLKAIAQKNGNLIGNYRRKKTTAKSINFRDVGNIRAYLRDKNCPRDIFLFETGINNDLQMVDILTLKHESIQSIMESNPIPCLIKMKMHNQRFRFLRINQEMKTAFQNFSKGETGFIFKTKYGTRLTSVYAGRLIGSWATEVGAIKKCYGTESLRKTFRHMQSENINMVIK